MRILLILLALGLSSCATQTDPFPEWTIPEASTSIQQPLVVPDRPKAASSTEDTITFDAQGIRDLEEFFQIAVANGEISQANANALQAQAMAFNQLLMAAKFQRQIGVIKSDLLKQERSARKLDAWFYRGILSVIGIGLSL